MILRLADMGRNVMMRALADRLDSGSIEIVSENGVGLSILRLPDPATDMPDDGVLEFRKMADVDAQASGTATAVRVNDSGGNLILEGDVSGAKGDGFLKLITTAIVAGVPVRISSFKLTMPSG